MTDQGLLARLEAHRTIGKAPREELEWIVAHGTLERLEPGELPPQSQAVDSLMVVLTGRMLIRVDRGAGPRKVLEWVGGDVAGLLPYSRMTAAPGDVTVVEPLEAVRVHRDHFRELVARCPTITATLVHVMLDRARQFTFSDYHDEKIMSLGRLAAGLAHELNNPASAVVRGAKALQDQLDQLDKSSRALGAAGLSEFLLRKIDNVRALCTPDTIARSAVERADREETIDAWLRAHRIDAVDVEALARSAITLDALDDLARALDDRTLPLAIRAITSSRVAHRTASEIETASSRIHSLMSAVKGFSRFEQAAVPSAMSIVQGLRDTLAVLNSKARAKNITVTLDIRSDVPQIVGVASELNQVWSNLIDNAIDASPESGQVKVVACREVDGQLVVKVIDHGDGIPPHLQSRVFDQFFTTKPQGQGTGLGLDIARRIVRSHDGILEFDTRQGLTEFRVRLPPATTSIS